MIRGRQAVVCFGKSTLPIGTRASFWVVTTSSSLGSIVSTERRLYHRPARTDSSRPRIKMATGMDFARRCSGPLNRRRWTSCDNEGETGERSIRVARILPGLVGQCNSSEQFCPKKLEPAEKSMSAKTTEILDSSPGAIRRRSADR